MGRHYLDHASTSPLRAEARDAMGAWLDGPVGDPGRVHAEGAAARAAVEQAREQVAASLGVSPRQLVFTSGGTEAVAAAVWGVLWDRPATGVAVADVEHSCVRESSARLAQVTELPVDGLGRIDPAGLAQVLGRERIGLVHCQWANHEVGTLQPVADVVALAHAAGAVVHSDAAAAYGQLPLELSGSSLGEMGADGPDLVSVSSHKMGGPTGVGALVLRRGLRIEPLLVGGQQERGRRAGMEHVAGIVGFGAAAEAWRARADTEREAAGRRSERLAGAALDVPGVTRVGDPVSRVPHIVCLAVEGVEAEPVLVGLDRCGVAVHSGSACASESLEPSPVLAAMGAPAERSLRASVGWSTTEEDVEAFAAAFGPVVEGLRALAGP